MNRRTFLLIVLAGAVGAAAVFALSRWIQDRSGKRDVQAYYFPVESLHSGLVYEYMSLNGDTSNREYWYFRSFEVDSGTFLSCTQYSRYFQIEQIVREKIVESGALARDLFLYEPDFQTGKQNKITASIEAQSVFPFNVTDSMGVFLFKLHYYLPGDSAHKIYLIRNRSYGGNAPAFHYKGKKLDAVRFLVREVVGSEGEGVAEGEAVGEEWYAKGIGLVQFKKVWGKGENRSVREFRLVNTFPMSGLEERAKAHLVPDE